MQQDSILWQRFKEGDRIAFESLIRTYYQSLFEYGRKFTPDRDALKDHVHDLFTNLWERRTVIGDTDHIKPYLLKSLRNRIIKEKQRSNIFSEVSDWEFAPAGFFDEDVETRIISDETSNEKKHQINHILSTLTRRQQEIIHLKFYQNLSNDQIADLLVISRPAVANLLYQTLKLFREKWHILLYSILSIILPY